MLIFNLTYHNIAVTKKEPFEQGRRKPNNFFSTSFPHLNFLLEKALFVKNLLS